MNLAENLKTIREAWGKTQDQMAQLYNSNRGRIHSYENGTEPPLSFLLKMEELSGFTITELLTQKINRLDVPEHPLSKGSTKTTVPTLPVTNDERTQLLQQTIAAQEKTIALLERQISHLESQLKK